MSVSHHLSSDGFNFGELGTHSLDFKSYGNLVGKKHKSILSSKHVSLSFLKLGWNRPAESN